MSYKLRFHKNALREWKKLDSSLREQFRLKLLERLDVYIKAKKRLLQ